MECLGSGICPLRSSVGKQCTVFVVKTAEVFDISCVLISAFEKSIHIGIGWLGGSDRFLHFPVINFV